MVEFHHKTNYAEVVPIEPNETTRAAMKDTENSKTVKCKDSADLFKKLGI